jgi:hypothetical protein
MAARWGTFCGVHRVDGRCHGFTAQGKRCQRKVTAYACASHWAEAVVV